MYYQEYQKRKILARILTMALSITIITALFPTPAQAEFIQVSLPWGGTGSANTWTFQDSYNNTVARTYTASSTTIYYQSASMHLWSAVDYIHSFYDTFSQVYNGFNTQPNDVVLGNPPTWVTTKHYWQNSSGQSVTAYTSVSSPSANSLLSGNASTNGCWAGGPCFPWTTRTFDDSDTGWPSDFTQMVYTGNWTTNSNSSAFKSTYRSSNTTGNKVSLRSSDSLTPFYGDSIIYVYRKGPDRGKASITIDGVSQGLIDLYASTYQWQQTTKFTNLGAGGHTIDITVSGQKIPLLQAIMWM